MKKQNKKSNFGMPVVDNTPMGQISLVITRFVCHFK